MDLSEDEQAEHKEFWKQGNRLAELMAAVKILRTRRNDSVKDLAIRLRSHVKHGQEKSLGRYLAPRKDGKFPNALRNFHWFSAICISFYDENHMVSATAESEVAAAVAAIAKLIGEMPVGARKLPIRRSSGVEMDRAELERVIATIPKRQRRIDPSRPAFPPHSPRFPAHEPIRPRHTSKYVLLIKDESHNPTGSHKDRWAWEKLLGYVEYIRSELSTARPNNLSLKIRRMSMISAGSAAYALQALLRLYGLPNLHVLMDNSESRAPAAVVEKLQAIGARVERVDLDADPIGPEKVCELTGNIGGIDATSRNAEDPFKYRYYDWLTYEILNLEPSYIFVPVGSGDLFANIISIIENQVNSKKGFDTRIKNPEMILNGINVLGARPKSGATQMYKLWAEFTPTHEKIEEKLAKLKKEGVIGKYSGIYPLEDSFASDALSQAMAWKFNSEISASAGLGLLFKMEKDIEIKEGQNVVVVNTGWLNLDHLSS